MVDKNIRIRDINNKALCICYYISNTNDLGLLEESIKSQLLYTDIRNYSLYIFTTTDLFNIVRSEYKDIIGTTNILKVDKLLLSRYFIMAYPEVVKYRTALIFKPNNKVRSRFEYNKLIEYHTTFPLVYLTKSPSNNFSDVFDSSIRNSVKNTLQLSVQEFKNSILNCYCSRVNRVSKFDELSKSLLPDTEVISFSTRLTKSPVFYEYMLNIMYNGIKSTDLVLKTYTDSKGYKVESFSNVGLQLISV